MRYHTHYHTDGIGHAYQQRLRIFPVQDDDNYFTVYRYVERNALRAGLERHADDVRWGSLWRWLQRPEPKLPLLSPWPMRRMLE